VSGSPGVGKSAMVLEAFRPKVSGRSYFAWGKFDAYSRSKPYGIWIQCFQFLIRKLLTEPEEMLDKWKTRFAETVGSNASVIADEISELRLLFDGLPPAEPMPARENKIVLSGFAADLCKRLQVCDIRLFYFSMTFSGRTELLCSCCTH